MVVSVAVAAVGVAVTEVAVTEAVAMVEVTTGASPQVDTSVVNRLVLL